MKQILLWTTLIVSTAAILALSSCAGLKVSIESELDAGTGLLDFLSGE